MFRLFSALLILLLGTAPAFSGEYVTCVQRQLADLGHDPGPVDGLMGRRTRAASQAFVEANTKADLLDRLPALTSRNALTWCRELGMAYSAAARFWPSAEKPRIKVGDKTWRRIALASAHREAKLFFALRHSIRPASRVDIGGSDNPRVLARYTQELMALRGTRAGNNLKTAQRHCDDDGKDTGAYAHRDQILFCWPARETYDSNWSKANKRTFERLMVHEFMHHIQNELTNAKTLRSIRKGARSPLGPEWLVEGSATVVELDFLIGKSGKKPWLFLIQAPAQASSLKLANMRSYGTVRNVEAYEVSLAATWLLAERVGREALIEYWRLVGIGNSWEEAFEASFGEPLDEFEARFQTLRSDLGEAIAYVEGGG